MVRLSCDDDIAGGRSIGALHRRPFFVEALIYSSIVHFIIKLSFMRLYQLILDICKFSDQIQKSSQC